MVKDEIVPPKCLFHAATQTTNNLYTLIEQSVHFVFLKVAIY